MHPSLWFCAFVLWAGLLAGSNAPAQLAERWRVVLTNTAIRDYAMTASGELVVAEVQVFSNVTSISKFDAAGELRWRRAYAGFDFALGGGFLAMDSAENVFIVGRTGSLGRVIVQKLNASGEDLWQTAEPFFTSAGPVLACDASGSVAVAGQGFGYWLMKYDAGGQRLWYSNYLQGVDQVKGLSVDGSGNLLVSRHHNFHKVSPDGIPLWSYESTRNISRFDVAWDGGVFVLNSHALIKLSEAGAVVWQRSNVTALLSVDPDGGVLIGQRDIVPFTFVTLSSLVRLDAAGNVLWRSPPPGDGMAFQRNDAGNYVGMMVSNAYWGTPFELGEITPAGEQLWLMVYTNAFQGFGGRSQAFLKAADGTYRLLAIPSFGSGHSVIASLESAPLAGVPRITRHPDSTNIVAGKRATFRVEASGDGPLKYEWLKGNELVTNANLPILRVNTHSPSDSADIFVEVSNAKGRVRSRLAELRVFAPPTPSNRVAVLSVALNGSIELAPNVEGTPPFAYQWSHNGLALSGETNSTLGLTNIQPEHAGSYSLLIRNLVGEALQSTELMVSTAVREEWRDVTPPPPWFLHDYRIAAVSNDLYVANGFGVTRYSDSGQRLWASSPADWVVPDGQGGIIIAASGGLMRYDAAGQELWRHAQPFYSPVVISNWVVTGYSDLYLRSVDGQESRYIDLQCEECTWSWVTRILSTSEGRIVCGGIMQPRDWFTNELALAWADVSGTQIAFARPGIGLGLNAENSFDLAPSPAGGVMVSGLMPVGLDGSRELLTVSYDHLGRELWRARTAPFGALQNFQSTEVHVDVDASGHVMVAAEGHFAKYDADGRELWRAASGHPDFGVQVPSDLRVSGDGEIYLLGWTRNDYAVVEKLDAMGNSLWAANLVQAFPGTGLHVSDDGRIYASFPSWIMGGVVAKLIESADAETPRITSNPEPHFIAIAAGNSLTLNAAAAGTGPLSYQWFRDGTATPILGATNPVLTLDNVRIEQSGLYFLEVRNEHGLVATRPVEISVGLPPSFELFDGGAVMASSFARVNEGGSVQLWAQIFSRWPYDPLTEPAGWQWSFNGQPILRATNPFVRLTRVSLAQAGTYTLTASNVYGTTSRSISLFVERRVRMLFTERRPGLDMGATHVVANSLSQLYLLGSLPNAVGWFLTKYQPNGQRLWTRQFGRKAAPAGMALDAKQNVFVAGTATLNGKGVVVLAKYDPNGTLLGTRYLAAPNGTSRFTHAFVQNAAGELFVCGVENFAKPRMFLTKFTAHGTPAWTKYITVQPSDYYYVPPTIAAASDGGVYVASPSGLFRFNAGGQRLWARGRDFFEVVVGLGGGVFVTGANGVAKYTPAGVRVWTLPVRGYGMAIDRHGLLFASEGQLHRITPDGVTLWSSSFYAAATALDRAGRAYASTAFSTVLTRAFDLQGQELWQAMELPPTSADIFPIIGGSDVVVCPNGDVAVAHAVNGNYVLSRYRPGALGTPAPPQISVDAGTPVVPGTRICFTAHGQSQPIAWFRNGVQLPFETNGTLCVTADWDTDGTYSVATLSGAGPLFSREVQLELQRPFLYPPLPLADEEMLVPVLPLTRWGPITIESSFDLRSWQPVTNFSAGPRPVLVPLPTDTDVPRFFRAVAD